ncbi:MAG: nitroreductase family protein [Dethiobacteria bacterium]
MDILTALQNRRSIRRFREGGIAEETLNLILDAARVAPSWKNMQCWRFIVVRDDKKKRALAETLHEGNPAVEAIIQAPVVIVQCADPMDSGIIDGKEYYLLDAGIAMQQLILAAHAQGLGTCWVAWFDEDKVRAVCRIPSAYKVVAMTPLGVGAQEPAARPRKKLEEIAFKEEWGLPLY